jgi:hypothetical protein
MKKNQVEEIDLSTLELDDLEELKEIGITDEEIEDFSLEDSKKEKDSKEDNNYVSQTSQ